MNKFIFLLLSTNIFTCEKPAPQKPKVIATSTYHDSMKIAVSHLNTATIHSHDSIQPTTNDQSKPLELNEAYLTYTNSAKRILYIAYEKIDDKNQIKLIFPEQNINTTLPALDSKPNTYQKDQIKWETDSNQRLGKLTVFGTWFEFMLKD